MNQRQIDKKAYERYLMKKRREQQVRRNVFLLCLSTIFIIAFTLSYHAFTSNAEDENATIYYKYYDCHTVEEGDTLWSIANTYNDGIHYASNQEYINEVISINHLSFDGSIQIGSNIVIPYYSNEFVY